MLRMDLFVQSQILSFLGSPQLVKFESVCRDWYSIIRKDIIPQRKSSFILQWGKLSTALEINYQQVIPNGDVVKTFLIMAFGARIVVTSEIVNDGFYFNFYIIDVTEKIYQINQYLTHTSNVDEIDIYYIPFESIIIIDLPNLIFEFNLKTMKTKPTSRLYLVMASERWHKGWGSLYFTLKPDFVSFVSDYTILKEIGFFVRRIHSKPGEVEFYLAPCYEGYKFCRIFHFPTNTNKWVFVLKKNDESFYQYWLLKFVFKDQIFDADFLFTIDSKIEAIHDKESKRIRFLFFDKNWKPFHFKDESEKCDD